MRFFTLQELYKSETAAKYGLTNVPDDSVKKNLIALIDNVLDPLREAYGKPVYISSGYRSPTVNALVKGSKTSHHMRGMAADIYTKEGKAGNKKLFELVKKLNLPFTQMIDENNMSWVHLSYDPKNVKRQILKMNTK